MKTTKRQNKIVEILEHQNFISIRELSNLFAVSEMTIRRDLKTLADANLIKRTYGGVIPAKPVIKESGSNQRLFGPPLIKSCKSDVLVITSFNPKHNPIFLERSGQPKLPLIAESAPHPGAAAQVGINDYRAGHDLGCWAGAYAIQHWSGSANVLIWNYDLPNTEARSRGFLSGLNETIPKLGDVISLNPTAQDDLAYQFTRDALEVNENINVIFTLNDTNAWGAIQACVDLKIDPHQTIVIPFGLEGDILKNALENNLYCPIGLAMFPEIVGRTCIDAAIAAHNHQELPKKIETPYAILTRETLPDFYLNTTTGWEFQWKTAQERFGFSWEKTEITNQDEIQYPGCVGIYLAFPKHEWYQNLVASMSEYANGLDIDIEILDADQNLKDELTFRKRAIAQRAAQEIHSGDVIFIDGGTVTQFMTEHIHKKTNITVITNATTIFKSLENNPNITLISTGGVLRRDSQSLVGPTAEKSLQDIRVDKLFLTVSGISSDFGLFHTNISEVTIKQTMIKSAREVILLADFTKFDQESFIQIAPIQAVNKLITDSGLPAHKRLQFNKAGIEVIIT